MKKGRHKVLRSAFFNDCSSFLAITENLSPRANYHDTLWIGQANRQDDSSKVMAACVIHRTLRLCWGKSNSEIGISQ